jgi:2-dehydro-3-deoxygalactonokinase
MTGELHHLLLTHSLIGAGLPSSRLRRRRFTPDWRAAWPRPRCCHSFLRPAPRTCWGRWPGAGERVSIRPVNWRGGGQHARLHCRRTGYRDRCRPVLSARYQQAFQLLGRQVTTVSGDDAFWLASIVHAVANLTSADRYSARHHPDEALAHVGAAIAAGFDTVEIPLNSPQWQQSIPAVVEATARRR